MIKSDELYSRYYKTTDPMEIIKRKRKISYNDLLNKMIMEKEIIASLICNTTDAKKIVEFSNACYIDDERIIPTIGESLYNKGKKVKILSPNLNTFHNKGFSTTNISTNNTFGKYNIITPDKVKGVDLFITEQVSKEHMKHFIDIAAFNKTCMFADSGSMEELVGKYDEIRKLFCDLSKSNNLEYSANIISEGDIAGAVYTIKRKQGIN